MSFRRCPGSLAFAQPKIELVRCPHCGDDVEVWTDEAEGKCANCGRAICRTTTQSCVDWCKYARECLGEEGHKKYQDMKSRLRKETLLKAADAHMADEHQRALARARVGFAEQILRREAAADPNVVIAAAALFAVSRPGSAGGDACTRAAATQEEEPPSAADEILHELGYPEGFVKEVDGILRHQREPGASDSINFRVVREAEAFARSAAEAKRQEPG
ncbi:MAG: hypothetical protein WCK89_03790 [bacterium]